jgi:hypothetical protein
MYAAFPQVSYGPILQRDQERIANRNWIYNKTNVEAVQMLRMRRAPFYELVKRFRREDCCQIASTPVWKSKLLCFFMLSVITRGSELCTTPLEDP